MRIAIIVLTMCSALVGGSAVHATTCERGWCGPPGDVACWCYTVPGGKQCFPAQANCEAHAPSAAKAAGPSKKAAKPKAAK